MNFLIFYLIACYVFMLLILSIAGIFGGQTRTSDFLAFLLSPLVAPVVLFIAVFYCMYGVLRGLRVK